MIAEQPMRTRRRPLGEVARSRHLQSPAMIRTACLAGLILLAACGGDGGGADTPEGHHDLRNGVTAEIGEIRDPVEPDREAEQRYGTDVDPEPGHRYVGVEVTYHNGGDTPVDASLEYGVQLLTDAGHKADNLDWEGEDVTGLPDRPDLIPPDGTVHGWVIFEVPDNEMPATLLLYGLIGDDPVTVNIA